MRDRDVNGLPVVMRAAVVCMQRDTNVEREEGHGYGAIPKAVCVS